MNSTAVTSTGMRMTQTLSAPPTQNTAPVHEYQCLYTSDLRQKKKRWQDGFLRFHTFNKRIMVYEALSRNYVGDKHWREDGEPQDGDELQLEKPVLVQVGEQVGRTETDLTELLEKRRKPQDRVAEGPMGSPRRQVASTAITNGTPTLRQPPGQPSQLRPKTLNALLGTPKRPIGRASVPTKSPHELRQESENAEWASDRPEKRQRIDFRTEVIPKPTTRPLFRTLAISEPSAGRLESIAVPDAAVDRPGQVQPARETIRKSVSASISRPSRTELDMASVDPAPSHGVPAKKLTKCSKAKPMSEPARTLRTMEKPRASREVKERSPSRHISNSSTMVDKCPSRSTTTRFGTKSVIERMETTLEETASNREPTKERMKLQMASRKPRKKLMYRDLLPQEQPSIRRSRSLDSDPNRESRERRKSSRPSRDPANALDDIHQEEQDRLADRLNKYNGRTSYRNDDIESITEPRAESPGLFVSQDDYLPLPASRHTKNDRPTEFYASTTKEPSCINSKGSRRPPSQGSAELSTPKAGTTVHDTALTLSRLDEILLPRSGSSHPVEISSPSHIVEDDSPVHVSSSFAVPVTTPKTVLGPTPQKGSPPTILIPSSPGFPTQSHAPEEVTSSKVPFQRPKSTPLNILSLSARFPQPPLNEETSAKAPEPKALPPMASSPRAPAPAVRLSKGPSPKPPPSIAPPSKVYPPPKALSPRSKPPDEPPPKDQPPNLPSPNPPLVQPIATTTKLILSNPPETSLPEFDLRIAQKPLPAFQAPKPKPKSRSPLKKSTSDTSTMRPPPELPSPRFKSRQEEPATVGVTNDGTSTPWSKEAWDLFGCGRDGVQCSYEEFKRKEGLD